MRNAVTRSERSSVPGCGIAVIAKASIPGRTKTRLVPPLTFDEAAQCNTAFLRDIADNILAARAEAPIAGYVAFGPPESMPFFQANIPREIGLIEAWYPYFGDCLFRAITQLLDWHHHSAVVLNCDSPTLPTSLLVETADVLAQPGDRVVLGPASDGGYYLLGLKAKHRRLFEDIAWSTEHVAHQTLARAAQLGLAVHILPEWYDVDDIDSFKLLQAELFEGRTFVPNLRPNLPRYTRAVIQSLIENSDLQNRLTVNDTFGRAAE